MSAGLLFLTVTVLSALGFLAARFRVRQLAAAQSVRPHSLINYYGFYAFILGFAFAFLTLLIWLVVQPLIINAMVLGDVIPGDREIGLVMSDIRKIAGGLSQLAADGAMSRAAIDALTIENTDIRALLEGAGVILADDVPADVLMHSKTFLGLSEQAQTLRMIVVLGLALGGLALALWRSTPEQRARNRVERAMLTLLISAASLAILTTLGIVLSLIFNTINFFNLFPAQDFFFGLIWSPEGRGGSEHLGIIPLLWGTLYISIIALIVAVPIGLFAAIYLSEYAGPKLRGFAKPLLEVLAGIPTIVYGLFALLTVGPLLVSVFGSDGGLGLGWMQGGTAVMTAGLVMGIMLIPFVSSLSDDIINAVPQAMRDGSLGLGATPSETIRNVVLPAALPGIVGAVLLAASRAIGETMIVVLGAGAAARLSMNPFDAMTTVTAKIVSQLTGDSDFASPEALVAFALGMSLFVITLGLNVFALYIVRKYREQYE